MSDRIVIVGGGLAGLCCARTLHRAGREFLLFEAADSVGGRIRTDHVDGFLLDRGFQVFLDSYPEAAAVLDYEGLELRKFEPGAVVRFEGQFHGLTDPWRRPLQAMGTVFSPIGSLADKLRVGLLRSQVLRGSLEDRFAEPEVQTLEALRAAGFSEAMIARFFQPFLGGIFLDDQLETSSRMFRFVFRMFSTGSACLPADGMESIPRQIAAALPESSLSCSTPVAAVHSDRVELSTGETVEATGVVVATDGHTAASLLPGSVINAESQGVTCLYYAADQPPINRPVLVLNGDGQGPINNLCVPTLVSDRYGPRGESLVSVTVLGSNHETSELDAAVGRQLEDWYGSQTRDWRLLKMYSIPHALPRQAAPALNPPERPIQLDSGIYVCGDHRDNASIQGAMISGRRTAETILRQIGGG